MKNLSRFTVANIIYAILATPYMFIVVLWTLVGIGLSGDSTIGELLGMILVLVVLPPFLVWIIMYLLYKWRGYTFLGLLLAVLIVSVFIPFIFSMVS